MSGLNHQGSMTGIFVAVAKQDDKIILDMHMGCNTSHCILTGIKNKQTNTEKLLNFFHRTFILSRRPPPKKGRFHQN